ncbi:MAG: arginine--tRNA ligase, partial [Spirochaetia bacterium]|nr:arginine--tRNA ligase [Spirochaetia bacterium]
MKYDAKHDAMQPAATPKEQLADSLRVALEKVSLDEGLKEKALAHPIRVEYPEKKFGDYASPIAMELARILKKNPLEIAEAIKAAFPDDPRFEKIEVLRPGFLNFTLSDKAREEAVRDIHAAAAWGSGEKKNVGKTLLEFVSANPTGPLHVGHGRWAAIGDTLARVLRYAGFDVETEFYVNDAGVQVGKLRESVKAVKEGRPVPEDGYRGAYIEDLKDVSEDPVEYFLHTQKETLQKIQSSFDRYFRETSLHESGRVAKTVEELKKRGATYESEGALWFKTTAYGDDKDRVLVKSDKTLTYFAVDIAYHRDKVERHYARLINIFGADHHGYTGRL